MRGFSLVELSIVLVILGLLTGGILSGQSLIRAAEIRAVTTEYGTYATAVHTFRDRYMAIPGDFKDATKFWGKDNAACSGDTGTASTPGTCNGNGNGMFTGALFGSANTSSEVFQFWKQLSLAGLIEGSYSGLAGATSGASVVFGSNIPPSKLGNSGWSVNYLSAADNSAQYNMSYGNTFYFGLATTSSLTGGKALKPEEAWNIDTKVDDGRPAYGKVIARYWNNECSGPDSGAVNSSNFNASYRVSDSSLQCALHFRDSF